MERRRFLEVAATGEETDVAHGLHERVGIIEDRLVLETCQSAVSEFARRPDLDQLHLAAVFPAAMREPALDVGGPGDQRVAVPEADGLTEPAADVGAEVGDRAFEAELATDLHVAQRVVGAAQELHAAWHDHDVELTWTAGPGPPAQESLGAAVHQ